MLIKEAIDRAKQAGWQSVDHAYWVEGNPSEVLYRETFLLDIQFWQALCGRHWKDYMRAFTEHLIEEGDVENFFAALRPDAAV